MDGGYTPTDGNSIRFEFTNSYTPPVGNSIAFEFLPDVEDKTQYVYPGSFFEYNWGEHTVYLGQRWVSVDGIASRLQFGEPVIAKLTFPQTFSPKWSGKTQFGRHCIFDKDVYYPPLGEAVFFDFKDGYTPPAGDGANLDFEPTYKREEGYTVYILQRGWDSSQFGEAYFDSLRKYLDGRGFDDHAFGLHAARLAYRGVKVSGFDPLQVGAAATWNKDRRVEAKGFDALAVGPNASIINRNRYILHGGSDYLQMNPKHSIWLWERHVKLEGRGPHTLAFGTQWASHYLREVIANRPPNLLGMGRPWAVEDPRYLNPRPIEPINITDRHVVGGLRFIEPVGNEMTEWGTRIIPESRTLYAEGKPMQDFGEHDVKNHTNYVKPLGFNTQPDEALRFGYQYVWNLRQIVQQQYDPNDGLNPPPFGRWTKIENRNREPQVFGWASSRFGYQFVWNKAAPIKPSGIAAPESEPFYKAGSVTHKNRPIVAHGINSLSMSGWGVVTNAADPLKPFGHDSLQAGRDHAIENRSRLYRNVGGMDTMAAGTPFIADAIREITFEPRYSIEPPRIELPVVDLYTRYVEDATAGESKYGVGIPALSIHWRIITPRWSFHPPAFIGEPALRNLTPELYQRGHNSEDYGDAFIRTQWRDVRTDGSRMDLFGRPIIRDRRHWVEFTGALPPPSIMPGPKVVRIGGLPDTQRILPPTIHNQNWLNNQVPRPFVGAQELYPRGFDRLQMGAPVVKANSIRVEPGIWYSSFGDAWFSLKNRTVGPAEGIRPITDVGKPRVSPHTIYAVMDAPKQAKDNHPSRELHYVDHDQRTNRSIKGVGNHRISLYHRALRASGVGPIDLSSAGRTNHRIYNAQNFVTMRGIQASRHGFHSVMPHDLSIEMYESQSYMVFGGAKVVRPPYTGPQYVSGKGFNTLSVPQPNVEFKDRERSMAGWSSMAMGESRRNDTPYMWQGLRVGPLMPTIPNGFNAERFGDSTWVSHRVREFAVDGFDTFACEYDYTNFAGRMRVWRETAQTTHHMIAPVGLDSFGLGVSDLRNKAHYILPDGNADQYRKGAPNA